MKRFPQTFDYWYLRNRRRVAWAGVACLLLSTLSACSGTRLLYNNLDWLAFEALDERFDVRADQVERVKGRLDALHEWHRTTQLPAYRQSLRELAARYADGLTAADLAWLEQRLERHRLALVERTVPELASFLADLDRAQLARYGKFWAAELEEAEEPLKLSPEQRLARRVEAFLERIEPWTGDLDGTQVDALQQDIAEMPDIRLAWLAQRQARRTAFLDLLSTRPRSDRIERRLYDWWRDLDAAYPPAYVAQRRAVRDRLYELLIALDTRLTSRQRARVLDRLHDYVSTIDTVLASR